MKLQIGEKRSALRNDDKTVAEVLKHDTEDFIHSDVDSLGNSAHPSDNDVSDNDESIDDRQSNDEDYTSSELSDSEESDSDEGELSNSSDETDVHDENDKATKVNKTTKQIGDENVNEKHEKSASKDEIENAIKDVKDEYAGGDSSDEEDVINTIGNVPLHWYDDHDHLGYDINGKAIVKPKRVDELDAFLRRMQDAESGQVTVQDPLTGQDVVLTAKQVEMIRRMNDCRVPDTSYDLYEDLKPWFSNEVRETPICNVPEPKRTFLPSIDEKRKVGRMVHSIKMGWMKTRAQLRQEKEKNKSSEMNKFYMLWKDDENLDDIKRINDLIPAPKLSLPSHAQSYNPPSEYLFTEKERQNWEEKDEEPWKRTLQFIPQKYESLRKVPSYSRFIRERFERCLDLYLAPRARKMKLTIQPEDLVPQLPRPSDLQPFPSACALTYEGHKNMVRCFDVDTSGQYIVSGSDDGCVRVWELQTGYCLKTYDLREAAAANSQHEKSDFSDENNKQFQVINSVEWCPNPNVSLLAIAIDTHVLLFNPHVASDSTVTANTDQLLSNLSETSGDDSIISERISTAVTWNIDATSTKSTWHPDCLLSIKYFQRVREVVWHGRGDYFATLLYESAQNRSVIINQLSRRRSQIPFSKSKGRVQKVVFHPTRPFLFVATQRFIRVYDLIKQEMTKKLESSARWISSMAIHPQGDNLIVSSYDKKVQWFDLDLSVKPYQVLRYHSSAVRCVAFHKRYPLFASGSDDTSIIVSHGMVYNDLLQNALIVPVKHLKPKGGSGHVRYDDLGVMQIKWHPYQPWLISSGADGTLKLWA